MYASPVGIRVRESCSFATLCKVALFGQPQSLITVLFRPPGPADAMHPMLPNYPALYRVGVDEDVLFPLLDHAAASLASWDELLDGTAFAAAMSAVTGGCKKQFQVAADKRTARLAGMQQSVMHFMNQPHPLTTLSDYQAYGPNGCISRFHNPDNYTQALRHLSNHH